jgi:hypothetical protein
MTERLEIGTPWPRGDAGVIDSGYLIAHAREGEGSTRGREAIGQAYRTVFSSELGRFVLLHHLMACGVGRRSGCESSDTQLRYSAGMMDSAIMLANEAGYDEAALAASVLTQELADERNPPDDGFGTVLGDDLAEPD